MKQHNPHTPILIREAMNIQPRVFARYEFGKEKMADLQGTWERLGEDRLVPGNKRIKREAARLLAAWTEGSGRELPVPEGEKRREIPLWDTRCA